MLSRRNLFLFRTLFGVLLLYEAAERILLFPFLFGPYSFLEPANAEGSWADIGWKLLLGLQFFSAAGVLLGRWPRVSAFIQLLCLQIVFSRIAFLGNGGDAYLLLGCLWILVLPVEPPLNRWRDAIASRESIGSSISVLLVAQFALTYLIAGFCKIGSWHTGEAVLWTLKAPLVSHFSEWRWESISGLLRGMTFFILWGERVLPLIFLFFFKKRLIRNAFVITFFFAHLMSFVLFDLGTLPFLCLIFWIALYLPRDVRENWLRVKWWDIRVWGAAGAVLLTAVLVISYIQFPKSRLLDFAGQRGIGWSHFRYVGNLMWSPLWIEIENHDAQVPVQKYSFHPPNRRYQRAVLKLLDPANSKSARYGWARFLCGELGQTDHVRELRIVGEQRLLQNDQMSPPDTEVVLFTDCSGINKR